MIPVDPGCFSARSRTGTVRERAILVPDRCDGVSGLKVADRAFRSVPIVAPAQSHAGDRRRNASIQ
jgi:hypothetical protein